MSLAGVPFFKSFGAILIGSSAGLTYWTLTVGYSLVQFSLIIYNQEIIAYNDQMKK